MLYTSSPQSVVCDILGARPKVTHSRLSGPPLSDVYCREVILKRTLGLICISLCFDCFDSFLASVETG